MNTLIFILFIILLFKELKVSIQKYVETNKITRESLLGITVSLAGTFITLHDIISNFFFKTTKLKLCKQIQKKKQ